MAEDLEGAIRTNAEGPAEAHGDSGGMKQHSLQDQIAAVIGRRTEPVLIPAFANATAGRPSGQGRMRIVSPHELPVGDL